MIGALRHTATISRKALVTGKGQVKEFAQIASGVLCLAVPVSPYNAIKQGLTVGKNYTVIFNNGTDVLEGDKLVLSTGVSLYVSGVAKYSDFGNVSHIEVNAETTGE